jgi:hypothetical protein
MTLRDDARPEETDPDSLDWLTRPGSSGWPDEPEPGPSVWSDGPETGGSGRPDGSAPGRAARPDAADHTGPVRLRTAAGRGRRAADRSGRDPGGSGRHDATPGRFRRSGRPRRGPAPPPLWRPAGRGRTRARRLVTGLLVVVGLFATGLGLGQFGGASLPDLFGDPNGGGPRSPALPRSLPTQVSIPSIQVAAKIISVGLAADGTIDTPGLTRKNTVGWYDQGPTPGQDGPAVLVGHVDTRSGPSVFYKLGKLRPRAKILISRKDHRIAVFRVDAVRVYPKSGIPASEVYGDFSRPGLRLITCGGAWVGGSTGYADNVVVFASLATD